MAKPSKKTSEQKLRIVLSVLRGEVSAAEAARRNGVSEQSVHNWKRLFLDAGREGLEAGSRRRSSSDLPPVSRNGCFRNFPRFCWTGRRGLGRPRQPEDVPRRSAAWTGNLKGKSSKAIRSSSPEINGPFS